MMAATAAEEETLAMEESTMSMPTLAQTIKTPETTIGDGASGASKVPDAVTAAAAAPSNLNDVPLPEIVTEIEYNEMDTAPARAAPPRLDSQDTWMGALQRVSSALRSGVSEAARAVSAATAVGGRGVAPRFLFVGDSTTVSGDTRDGFIARIREHYLSKARISTYGATGYCASWGSRILLRALRDEPDARVCFIWFGAADCSPQAAAYLPIEEYRLALAKMALHAVNEKVVPVLVTPPPSTGALAVEREAYASACREIALQLRVPLVDAFAVLSGPEGKGLEKNIGAEDELTALGHEKVFEAIVSVVNTKMCKFSRDNLKEPFVRCHDVNPLDPTDSLGVGL